MMDGSTCQVTGDEEDEEMVEEHAENGFKYTNMTIHPYHNQNRYRIGIFHNILAHSHHHNDHNIIIDLIFVRWLKNSRKCGLVIDNVGEDWSGTWKVIFTNIIIIIIITMIINLIIIIFLVSPGRH